MRLLIAILAALVAVALLLRPRRAVPMVVWASTIDDESLVPMASWRASYDCN